MKRNWDVIRKIMVKLEDLPTESSQLDSDAIVGVDNETVFYHMRMMIEAGLAIGGCPEMLGACHGYLLRLSWEGHELLDKIRRESVWNKVKDIAKTKSIDLSIDVVKSVAKSVIADLLA